MRKSIKFLKTGLIVFMLISSYFIFNNVVKINAAANNKQEDIKHLMKLMGMEPEKIVNQVLKPMISLNKKMHKDIDIPDEFWNDLFKEMLTDMIKLMIPWYEKHFTHEEIKELIKFYESPLGKKMVKVQPLMMQEMMPKIQEWTKTLSKRLKDMLEKKESK